MRPCSYISSFSILLSYSVTSGSFLDLKIGGVGAGVEAEDRETFYYTS